MRRIVILSSIDWKTQFQLHHQLALSFEQYGDSVLFIENTGIRAPQIKDIRRIKDRLFNWMSSCQGFKTVSSRIEIYYPILIPLPRSRIAGFFNSLIIESAIRRWLGVVPGGVNVFITFLPNILSLKIIQSIEFDLSLYYCANDMRGPYGENRVLSLEEKLVRSVNRTYTISEKLIQYIYEIRDDVCFFPPGVQFQHLRELYDKTTQRPSELAGWGGKIVGYFGAVGPVFDVELLYKMALSFPQVLFLVIGPHYVSLSSVSDISNVLLLGERPHDELPAYAKFFDCAIVPYVVNEYTDCVYSCKLHEYLAFGLPVVSTAIHQHRVFKEANPELILLGSSHEEFISKISEVLYGSFYRSPNLAGERIAVARENAWDSRFAAISADIDAAVELNRTRTPNVIARLKRYFNGVKFLRVYLTSFTVGILVLFYSPIVPQLGQLLIMRDPLRPVDAIVVFSGDANVSYNNFSFEGRVLDALRAYNEGHAKFIVLASGRDRLFKEIDLMYLLLVERGVPDSAIKKIPGNRKSTFENVMAAGELMRLHGLREILFVTSPYHSRRAVLVWRKNFPDLIIHSPEVVDTPPQRLSWGLGFSEMRVIFYEWAAILYNRILGRL